MDLSRISNHWLFRIVAFALILYVLQNFLFLTNFGINLYFYGWFLILIVISVILESLDQYSSPFNFGLLIDRNTSLHIKQGFLLTLSACIVFPLIAFITGGNFEVYSPDFSLLLYSLFFAISTAISEELLFRGIIFQAVFSRFGPLAAVLLSAIVFALLHLNNIGITTLAFINIFLAGLLLGIMFVKTYSLWLAISFHFFWNFLIENIIGSRVSGAYAKHVLFYADLQHLPVWLSGGSFGIEGSIITSLLLLGFIYYVYKYTPVSPVNAAGFFRKLYKIKGRPNYYETA